MIIFMTIKKELQNKKGKDIDYDMLETLGYNEQILFKVEKYIDIYGIDITYFVKIFID